MKKIFLLTAVMVIAGRASAQTAFGVKGGLNYSKITVLSTNESLGMLGLDYKASFHIGGYLSSSLGEKLYIQSELQYSNKGGRPESGTLNLPYLVIPVMLGYKPIDRLRIEGGLELGYLLANREYYSTLDLSLNGGAVFSVTEALSAGMRYVLGINSVYGEDVQFTDEKGNLIEETVILPNRVLQVSLYYNLLKL